MLSFVNTTYSTWKYFLVSCTAVHVPLLTTISKGRLAKAAGTAAAATLETICSPKPGDSDSVYACARVCGSMSTLEQGREDVMSSQCPWEIPRQTVHSPVKISINVTIRVKVCPPSRRFAIPKETSH